MFKGSFPALITPFKDGAVDESAFKSFVDWQITEGSDGLVPCGTTGESPTLSHEEHMQVTEWCIEAADGRGARSPRRYRPTGRRRRWWRRRCRG